MPGSKTRKPKVGGRRRRVGRPRKAHSGTGRRKSGSKTVKGSGRRRVHRKGGSFGSFFRNIGHGIAKVAREIPGATKDVLKYATPIVQGVSTFVPEAQPAGQILGVANKLAGNGRRRHRKGGALNPQMKSLIVQKRVMLNPMGGVHSGVMLH